MEEETVSTDHPVKLNPSETSQKGNESKQNTSPSSMHFSPPNTSTLRAATTGRRNRIVTNKHNLRSRRSKATKADEAELESLRFPKSDYFATHIFTPSEVIHHLHNMAEYKQKQWRVAEKKRKKEKRRALSDEINEEDEGEDQDQQVSRTENFSQVC